VGGVSCRQGKSLFDGKKIGLETRQSCGLGVAEEKGGASCPETKFPQKEETAPSKVKTQRGGKGKLVQSGVERRGTSRQVLPKKGRKGVGAASWGELIPRPRTELNAQKESEPRQGKRKE